MSTFLIETYKKTQILVLKVIKKAKTLSVSIKKKSKHFNLKIQSTITRPPVPSTKIAFITVITSAPSEVVYIDELTPLDGTNIVVDWGDYAVENITVGGNISHTYSLAGEYKIKIKNPENVKVLDIAPSNYIIINSKDIMTCVNIEKLRLEYLQHGTFYSGDFRNIRPDYFYLSYSYDSYVTLFNSSHISEWNPTYFYLIFLGANEKTQVVFNSSDIASWSPEIFMMGTDVEKHYGSFNSSDISSWSPESFSLRHAVGEFNSSDVTSWNPSFFSFTRMLDGTTGTFDTLDVASWTVLNFYLSRLPASYNIVISDNSLRNWTAIGTCDFADNQFSQSQVDKILEEFYIGFPNKTLAGGNLYVGYAWDSGTSENATPSGDHQASASPSYGKEYRYELLNDSQNLNPTKKWQSVTIEDNYIDFTMFIDTQPYTATIATVKFENASSLIDWGDGNKEIKSSEEVQLTHLYNTTGTLSIKIYNPEAITSFKIDSSASTAGNNLLSFDFSIMENLINLNTFFGYSTNQAYEFNSLYLKNLPIQHFLLDGNGFNTGERTINSADMASWNIDTFRLTLSIGYGTGIINTSDMSNWNPTSFVFERIPDTISGTFNTADLSQWTSIDHFEMYYIPSTITGIFNSSDFSTWSALTHFNVTSLPESFTGTIDTTDFQNKPITLFNFFDISEGIVGNIYSSSFGLMSSIISDIRLYNLSSSISGTFDTGDFSTLTSLIYLYFYEVPGVTITVTPNSFSSLYSLWILKMANNSLARTQVDQILSDLWDAFPSRTQVNGYVYLDGTNNSPSGIFQAANPPTTGMEYAYELLNDTQNINPTMKWFDILISDYNREFLSGMDSTTLGVLDPQTLVEIEVIE